MAVDTHAIPVINEQGVSQGAILLFHDASSETSLEQQCQSLHEKATKDPLTQVANRAEFDRVHAMFVTAHQQQYVPCSLMMCDLDRFKLVNDTFGHQAGDAAIKCLASLLKSSCRPGDLVARYGGEEFVLLCADCDNASATRRAEQIRKALSQIAQPKLDGRTVTVQLRRHGNPAGRHAGDDAPPCRPRLVDRQSERSEHRRATGQRRQQRDDARAARFRQLSPPQTEELLCQDLVTPVPVKMAVEKLRGFVADHRAKIVAIDGSQLRLEIEDKPASRLRRLTDRPVAFWIDLSFQEERLQKDRAGSNRPLDAGATRTKIHVTVSPRRNRDRRRNDVLARAREVLMSFRSYLMASEDESDAAVGALTRSKQLLSPWMNES